MKEHNSNSEARDYKESLIRKRYDTEIHAEVRSC